MSKAEESTTIPSISAGTKLLTMCSSKSRTHRIMEMVNSFNATKRGKTELVIYISHDDPELPKYKEILAKEKYIIGPPRNMIQVLNYLSCEAYPDVEYYSEVNDDHKYITEGWDTIMMDAIAAKNGWAVAYGVTRNFPTASMMSRKVVRAMGHFALPSFVHMGVDLAVRELYTATKLWLYLPNVLVEHKHWVFGLAKCDQTYKNSAHTGCTEHFEHWKKYHMQDDINKILAAKESDRQHTRNEVCKK